VTGGPRVLFACVHNAGRSQMALGFFRHLAGDPAGLELDGVRPIRDEIERRVRGLLAELGVPAR
jgi:arsenate reductase